MKDKALLCKLNKITLPASSVQAILQRTIHSKYVFTLGILLALSIYSRPTYAQNKCLELFTKSVTSLTQKRTKQESLKLAKDLMDRQHSMMLALLSTSGYKSLTELRSAIVAAGTDRAKVVSLLEDPRQHQFVLNRPNEARNAIIGHGFLDLFATGLTQGGAAADGSKEMRAAVESSYLNMTPDEYKSRGPELMAQFGYLRPNPKTGIRNPTLGYGDDTWIFKASSVENFVTVMAGDSLNRWRDLQGNDAVASTSRNAGPVKSWDQLFVPWQDRLLVAPFVAIQSVTSYHESGSFTYDMMLVTGGAHPSQPPVIASRPTLENYVELQYWCPLDMNDVEGFEFTIHPPTGEFLAALRAHHIKIFDARIDENISEYIFDDSHMFKNPDWPPKKLWPPKEWNGLN